jgi:hypothetical protein
MIQHPSTQETDEMTTADVKYRVIRLPDMLRTAIRATRDANKWTNGNGVLVASDFSELVSSAE